MPCTAPASQQPPGACCSVREAELTGLSFILGRLGKCTAGFCSINTTDLSGTQDHPAAALLAQGNIREERHLWSHSLQVSSRKVHLEEAKSFCISESRTDQPEIKDWLFHISLKPLHITAAATASQRGTCEEISLNGEQLPPSRMKVHLSLNQKCLMGSFF